MSQLVESVKINVPETSQRCLFKYWLISKNLSPVGVNKKNGPNPSLGAQPMSARQ